MDLPALALAFGVAWTPVPVPAPKPSPAASAVYDASGAARTWGEALADLAAGRVVAVGETHDDPEHHRIQAEVLAALAGRTPRLAVAFEMVGFEDQATLDSFMSGALSEDAFAAWWKANWGFDFALYKPIFDAAKAAGVPAYGLNAPRELVKAVSKCGLASLPPADRARLPVDIRESADARYRAYVLDSVSGHGAPSWAIPRMIEAMAVWNETMGQRIAEIAAEGRVVLVIAGQGHVFYKAGLIESAARRGASPARTLLAWSGAPQTNELALGDWFSAASAPAIKRVPDLPKSRLFHHSRTPPRCAAKTF
ncbi:MAG: ChaN family lipoprotein [Elusimicrobia bacterium]|nr:ChaN family lipoprotein [Elusimicrobiota bacterium]